MSEAPIGHRVGKWLISGPLKAGQNRVTFASKGGKDALHLIAAARVTVSPDAGLANACNRWGSSLSIVRRDHDVVPEGAAGYVRKTC